MENFANLADNTLVIADSQTAGRGRRGKQWISPPGMNLYASYIVKNPSFPIGRVLWCGGLATLVTLAEFADEMDIWLKWPNDICCSYPNGRDYRKIAGLLAETWSPPTSNQVEGVVAGIGVNLNMPKALLQEIDQPATSVFAETGRNVDIAKFAETLLGNLLKLRTLAATQPDKFFEIWRDANGLIDREIKIKADNSSTVSGIVKGVTAEGAIEVIEKSGIVKTVITGDVEEG